MGLACFRYISSSVSFIILKKFISFTKPSDEFCIITGFITVHIYVLNSIKNRVRTKRYIAKAPAGFLEYRFSLDLIRKHFG